MPWRVWAVIVLAGAVGVALGLAAAGGLAWPGSRAENVFGGAAVGLVAAGLACLLAAAVAARRAGRSPTGPRPMCRECGSSVPPGAAVCPWCGSGELTLPAARGTPGGGGVPAVGRALPLAAYSNDASGVIGWVDSAPGGWAGAPPDAAALLRFWAWLLLALGSPFAALSAAALLGPWLGLLVLLVTAGASAAIARRGPGVR
jgi:hypothetical protein